MTIHVGGRIIVLAIVDARPHPLCRSPFERANVSARNAHARIRRLDCCFDRHKAVLHRRGRRYVQVGSEHFGGSRITLVNLRKHGGGKGPARGPRFDARVTSGHGGLSGVLGAIFAVGGIGPPCVLDRALDERHRHLLCENRQL